MKVGMLFQENTTRCPEGKKSVKECERLRKYDIYRYSIYHIDFEKYFIKDKEYYENVINFYITLNILVALGHRFKNTLIPMPFVF